MIYLKLIVIGNLLVIFRAGCTMCACKRRTDKENVSDRDTVYFFNLSRSHCTSFALLTSADGLTTG